MQVRTLAWKDPLEEGMATHSIILAWRIPMGRGAWWAIVHRVAKSWIHTYTHTETYMFVYFFSRQSVQREKEEEKMKK